MKQLSVVVIGCGNHGNRYIEAMMKLPGKFVVKAIAEPVKAKGDYLKDLCNIPEDMCFESREQLLELPKLQLKTALRFWFVMYFVTHLFISLLKIF